MTLRAVPDAGTGEVIPSYRDAREAAEDFIRRGFKVVPLLPRSKKCSADNWTAIEFKAEDFEPGDNIGLRSVDGVVVVDLDAREAVVCGAMFLPPTGFVYGRKSKPKSKWVYRSTFEKTIALKDTDAGDTLAELRANHQDVVFPSTNPDGEKVEPGSGATFDVATVDEVVLSRALRLIGTAALVSRYYNPSGNRHEWCLALAGALRQASLTEEECVKVMTSAARWANDGKLEDRLTEVRSTYRRSEEEPTKGERALVELVSDDHGPAFVRSLRAIWGTAPTTFALTDSGNAECFAARYAGLVRFDHDRKFWLLFAKHHWRIDRTRQVDRYALTTVRGRQREALRIADTDQRKRHIKWSIDSENRSRRDNLVHLASSNADIAVDGEGWDLDPWALGVQNGVVDLRTGHLRNGTPKDGITKVSPVAFDPTARCPRWEQFVLEIMSGNESLAQYLQRIFGYALTGDTSEQVFWIFWGDGSNGKSTLMETFMRFVLGDDYTWTMPFPSDKWSDALGDYQKATLVGRRLVAANETKKQAHLNEELIKSLTGGDTINARHPYGRPFTFVPEAKFILRVNPKPVISDQSHGMWRRLKLVPFERKFGEDSEKDTTLPAKLRAETSGILAWAVRGCLDWQRDGLRHPPEVEAATAEYRTESDPFLMFIAECCVVEGDLKATAETPRLPVFQLTVGATELFKAYLAWCDDQIEPIERMSQRAFGMRVRSKFKVKEGNYVTYVGVGLREGAGGGGPRL